MVVGVTAQEADRDIECSPSSWRLIPASGGTMRLKPEQDHLDLRMRI